MRSIKCWRGPSGAPAYTRVQLVVSDIHAARSELVERGVEVSEVQEFPWGAFVFFSDPDGNGWAVQAVPARN